MVSGAVLELRDLSTLTRGEKGWGMIAADEGAVIQLVRFVADGAGMSVSQNITLADPPGLEIDFEASTYMDGWFYVTGSHGAGKKKGTYSDPRARIYRFRLATESPEVERVEMASLAPILAAEPLLSPFHRQPLQQRGVNIKGLAYDCIRGGGFKRFRYQPVSRYGISDRPNQQQRESRQGFIR